MRVSPSVRGRTYSSTSSNTYSTAWMDNVLSSSEQNVDGSVMPEELSKTTLEHFLNFLLPHSVHTGQNALIWALSLWLDEHYPSESARSFRTEALVQYESWVGQ